MANDAARFKQQAGEEAAALVESGMVVGLGTGSTAIFATRRIAARLLTGDLTDIIAIATSVATDRAARELGIPLMTDDIPRDIDITIDGADEVDSTLTLIKGGGGALLREKIVAQATRRQVIVVDESKLSPRIGTSWALPVEVLAFGWRAQARFLETLGATIVPRERDGDLFRTDQGNMILDSRFGPIADPAGLASLLGARAGIVEHGLFIGITHDLFVAGEDGVRHLRQSDSAAIQGAFAQAIL
jgi:ribose 5-phosphate isomerase A